MTRPYKNPIYWLLFFSAKGKVGKQTDGLLRQQVRLHVQRLLSERVFPVRIRCRQQTREQLR